MKRKISIPEKDYKKLKRDRKRLLSIHDKAKEIINITCQIKNEKINTNESNKG